MGANHRTEGQSEVGHVCPSMDVAGEGQEDGVESSQRLSGFPDDGNASHWTPHAIVEAVAFFSPLMRWVLLSSIGMWLFSTPGQGLWRVPVGVFLCLLSLEWFVKWVEGLETEG